MKQGVGFLKSSLAAFLVAAALAPGFAARAADDIQTMKTQAQQAKTEFLQTDPSLQDWFDKSAGYVIFPDVGKGGLVLGGARGRGVVYEKGVPVGSATMTQATVGAQVGGQTFSQIIFFETPAALQDFKESRFEMSAEASAVAAAAGVSRTANYQNHVAVFTLPKKGLMAQASVGGQKFRFEPWTQTR